LYSLLKRLSAKWPDNDVVNIVCHGHSVPAGYFKTPDVRTLDSYPQLLLGHIKGSFPHAVVNVIVTARGGENAESGSQRFERDVLCHRPALITIDYALNDRKIGLNAAAQAWTTMITASKRAGAEIMLLTPSPDLESAGDGYDDELKKHGELLRKLSAQFQVHLVDVTAAFRQWCAEGHPLEGTMSQHNHPNREGHSLIAQALMRTLRAMD